MELIADNHAEIIVNLSKPDDIEPAETFGKAFKNAVVRFTSFITILTIPFAAASCLLFSFTSRELLMLME